MSCGQFVPKKYLNKKNTETINFVQTEPRKKKEKKITWGTNLENIMPSLGLAKIIAEKKNKLPNLAPTLLDFLYVRTSQYIWGNKKNEITTRNLCMNN